MAAYLLNPLKNDYDAEDVAREHLNLLIDEKLDDGTKSCYEAYTALCLCSSILRKKLEENGMFRLFNEIEMPLVFTLYEMEQAGVKVEGEDAESVMEKSLEQESLSWKKRFMKWQGKNLISILRNSLGVILV